MSITTPDSAVEAARTFGEHTGPLATLATGTVLQCFGQLRIRLADLRTDALAAMAVLNLSDGTDDPLGESGRREMADITNCVADLKAWVQVQQCQAAVCECRADRLLRVLLEAQFVPVQSGYRPTDRRRPVALMAGYSAPAGDGTQLPYVLIDYRNNSAHAVRDHRGWRARLITDGTSAPVYTSPDYPETPVGRYHDDTRTCAAAVVAVLSAGRSRKQTCQSVRRKREDASIGGGECS
ncbi:hypothetical protein ACIBBE_24140 [Streptomyces sp. NPDC051644]|uniref:hypothetical protein n=1 Tax=Streptomyces sp. NPDC051644 TaxID=3365666 RepID=UPI0037B5FE04